MAYLLQTSVSKAGKHRRQDAVVRFKGGPCIGETEKPKRILKNIVIKLFLASELRAITKMCVSNAIRSHQSLKKYIYFASLIGDQLGFPVVNQCRKCHCYRGTRKSSELQTLEHSIIS